MSEGKIISAFAEWDDRRGVMRVYLDDGTDNPPMLQREVHGNVTHARLYRAAFIANPKDFSRAAGLNSTTEPAIGWEPRDDDDTRGRAERAADAVNAELVRMRARKPGPTDAQVNAAAQLVRGR